MTGFGLAISRQMAYSRGRGTALGSERGGELEPAALRELSPVMDWVAFAVGFSGLEREGGGAGTGSGYQFRGWLGWMSFLISFLGLCVDIPGAESRGPDVECGSHIAPEIHHRVRFVILL